MQRSIATAVLGKIEPTVMPQLFKREHKTLVGEEPIARAALLSSDIHAIKCTVAEVYRIF